MKRSIMKLKQYLGVAGLCALASACVVESGEDLQRVDPESTLPNSSEDQPSNRDRGEHVDADTRRQVFHADSLKVRTSFCMKECKHEEALCQSEGQPTLACAKQYLECVLKCGYPIGGPARPPSPFEGCCATNP